ncbi:MAG: AEC family transporter [Clostridiales bacterium]|nr:AEC family transporter [Clostridiales bacterium]
MSSNLVSIAAQQVLVLFLLLLVGYVSVKAGAVKAELRSGLSDLLLNVILPAMIINSYLTEYDPSISANLAVTLAASTAALLVSIGISALVCTRVKSADAPLMRFAMGFCNAGYMGFPLISALFGSEGLLYASVFHTMYNLFVWTVGVSQLERDKKGRGLAALLDVLKKPTMIAMVVGLVIYFGQIPVPDLIAEPIGLLSNVNTPMAMFITGMVMAGSNLKDTVKDGRMWLAVGMRLLVIPAVTLVLCRVAGVSGMVGAVVVLLAACPCASITSVFAVRYQYEEALGAGMVVVSTLLSIGTLPLFAALVSLLG